MKELTIEEKAKAFDEALERAKSVIEQNPLMEYLKKGIEYIFPVLKESEDEKIRKALITKFTKEINDGAKYEIHNIPIESILTWLEKQDAKISIYSNTLFKIATILSQYEDKDDSPLEKIRSIMIDGTICSMDLESKKKERDEQKPTDEEMKILLQTEYEKGRSDAIEQNPAWSEDDENILEAITYTVKYSGMSHCLGVSIKVMFDWLKSLKERIKEK